MEIGSSVNIAALNDAKYLELLSTHFDWWYYDQGFGWKGDKPQAKAITKLALDSGKKLRGNCLLSATTTKYPKGTFVDKEEIFSHIRGILENFPEINHWDCTHEALNPLGELRNSFPNQILGPQWQEIVFKYAHSLNTKLSLFYCDYFRGRPKWQAAYQMISRWLDQGIPVKGISLQLHSNLKPSFSGKFATLNIEECSEWMDKFRNDLKLVIHVPESVVWQPEVRFDRQQAKAVPYSPVKERVNHLSGRLLQRFWDVEDAQMLVYGQLASACIKADAEMQGYWSAFDSYPWNWIGNRSKAGFWDENYIPKKCFSVIASKIAFNKQ